MNFDSQVHGTLFCFQGKQKWSELELRRLLVERYEDVDWELRRQVATENIQMRTVGICNIGFCDGGVNSLIVLCLAKWTS